MSVLLTTGEAIRRSSSALDTAAGRRLTAVNTRILDHKSQITHGEIACTNIADERKAVSELEVAHCEYVALEVRGDRTQSVSVNVPGGNTWPV